MKQIIQQRFLSVAGAIIAFGTIISSAGAQLIATRQVADLSPGGGGSFPTNLTVYAGGLYFSATTLPLGEELWKYDGSSIVLVTNINDQVTDLGGGLFVGHDSNPAGLKEFDGALSFSAYDARRGAELWRFDGTNAFRAADINPDANDTIKTNPNNSFPNQLTVLGNELFFSADGGGSKPNYELWKYDGTNATRVANIHPDSGSDFGAYPTGLTAFDGALYFMATDGVNGYELWKSAGTNAVLLANLNPGGANSDSFPKYFTPFNGRLYFQASNSSSGYELWSTDGTNTAMVANLNPSGGSSYPEGLTVFGNALYFRANDGTNGFELWKYDGTVLSLVSNINLGGDAFPKNLTVFQNQLFFAADDGIHGWELWKYDGTNASLVTDLDAGGDSFPELLTPYQNSLFFTATTAATGYEWWSFDGNAVTLAADINPGNGSSFPQFPAILNDELCFSAADDGLANWELWTFKPVPLRITAVEQVGENILLTWNSVGGTTNIVQISEAVNGIFTNLSPEIVVPGNGESTATYSDTNGISSLAKRFYRIVRP